MRFLALLLLAGSANAALIEPGETFYITGAVSGFSDPSPYSDWTTLEVGDYFVMSATYNRLSETGGNITYEVVSDLFFLSGSLASPPANRDTGWIDRQAGYIGDMAFGAEGLFYLPLYLSGSGVLPEALPKQDLLTSPLAWFAYDANGTQKLWIYFDQKSVTVPTPAPLILLAAGLLALTTTRRRERSSRECRRAR